MAGLDAGRRSSPAVRAQDFADLHAPRRGVREAVEALAIERLADGQAQHRLVQVVRWNTTWWPPVGPTVPFDSPASPRPTKPELEPARNGATIRQ